MVLGCVWKVSEKKKRESELIDNSVVIVGRGGRQRRKRTEGGCVMMEKIKKYKIKIEPEWPADHGLPIPDFKTTVSGLCYGRSNTNVYKLSECRYSLFC